MSIASMKRAERLNLIISYVRWLELCVAGQMMEAQDRARGSDDHAEIARRAAVVANLKEQFEPVLDEVKRFLETQGIEHPGEYLTRAVAGGQDVAGVTRLHIVS